MEMRIKATNYEITPDVSKYLDTRLKAVEKLVAGVDGARLEAEVGRSAKHSKKGETQWFAEFNLKAKKNRWRAVATAATVKAAIDIAKDELALQIKKEKALRVTAVKRGGKKVKDAIRRS
jgi:ribosomal subunit interface protein